MAIEQYLTHSVLHNQPFENDGTDDWKSSSVPSDINSSGCFDCNICLETVQDPVVTICGHLYCWPCIYKWIHQQSISPDISADQHPQCPVCKAEVTEETLIPLYGRGQSKAASFGSVIPDRPKGPTYGVHALVATSTTTTSGQNPTQQDARGYHHSHPPYPAQAAAYYPNYGDYSYPPAPAINLAGITTFQPLISMFGEMIYSRFSGNSQLFHTNPSSYGMAAMGSERARRHVMQADRSLSRFSFFLFCCMVLCLLLF